MAPGTRPSGKIADHDFSPMMLRMKLPGACACTCACCAAGRCGDHGGGRPMSPHPERPLGCEPEAISAEALKRRHDLIVEVLLPHAKTLAAALSKANEQGGIGFGELELLGTLQHWILQLQVEHDGLRLDLTPPELDSKP
jgi:hypothetical protein